jgi:hypothetical protein
LEVPSPVIETSLSRKSPTGLSGANPDVIEAEQNVVKASVASTLAKLDYVPDVIAAENIRLITT